MIAKIVAALVAVVGIGATGVYFTTPTAAPEPAGCPLAGTPLCPLKAGTCDSAAGCPSAAPCCAAAEEPDAQVLAAALGGGAAGGCEKK